LRTQLLLLAPLTMAASLMAPAVAAAAPQSTQTTVQQQTQEQPCHWWQFRKCHDKSGEALPPEAPATPLSVRTISPSGTAPSEAPTEADRPAAPALLDAPIALAAVEATSLSVVTTTAVPPAPRRGTVSRASEGRPADARRASADLLEKPASPSPPLAETSLAVAAIANLLAKRPDRVLTAPDSAAGPGRTVMNHLYSALIDPLAELCGRMGWGALALGAGTFRPARATWRARLHTSPLAHRMLSKTLVRRSARFEVPYDIALQVHGWVAGQPHPYALYVDQTRLMAERGWPQWLPLPRRERAAVLDRERQMYAAAAHILTMGQPARESLMAEYEIDPHRITVVGGGLMFDRLPTPSSRPPEVPTIMFVGREFERKGGDCLLEAFSAVRTEILDARLVVVGTSHRSAPPGVVFLGRVWRSQLSQLYRAARVFCLPTYYEPFGLVFAEAMAHAVPCVGTSVQSIPEILDHGHAGVLIRPGDPEGLAAALVRLLTDRDMASRLGQAGRRRVEHQLLWKHVAGRAAPVLEGAAAQRR